LLDVAVAYNRYKFLGYEFLTWLWFLIESGADLHHHFPASAKDGFSMNVGNRIVMENRSRDNLESVTIQGDDAGFEEAKVALRKGAFAAELNLTCRTAHNDFRFTVKAENLTLTNLRISGLAPAQSPAEREAAVLEKAYLLEQIGQLLESLFVRFIKTRISPDWNSGEKRKILSWMAPERSTKDGQLSVL
jgi:hypothetical protein